jgi:hypothetical protein
LLKRQIINSKLKIIWRSNAVSYIDFEKENKILVLNDN